MAGNAVSGGTLAAPTRVSTLELFFDLVFVFTITQLTSVLASHPSQIAAIVVLLGACFALEADRTRLAPRALSGTGH